MTIAQEEIFGPVGAVIGFDTDEEAIRIANDSRFGLNGGIETADAAKGYEMAPQIRAGSVALNGGTGRMTYAPIGGYQRSGIGREYGPDWLREYPQEKSIFYPRSEERRVGKAGVSPGNIRWSPDHSKKNEQ